MNPKQLKALNTKSTNNNDKTQWLELNCSVFCAQSIWTWWRTTTHKTKSVNFMFSIEYEIQNKKLHTENFAFFVTLDAAIGAGVNSSWCNAL